MAIETVPAATAVAPMLTLVDADRAPKNSADPVELASSALWEITSLSILMRDHIAKNDLHGTIEPVTRGMLARVQQLSEVVDECISRDKDSAPLAKLAETIACRRQTSPSIPARPPAAD